MFVKLSFILLLACSASYAINKNPKICKKICVSTNICIHVMNMCAYYAGHEDYTKCELICGKSLQLLESKLPTDNPSQSRTDTIKETTDSMASMINRQNSQDYKTYLYKTIMDLIDTDDKDLTSVLLENYIKPNYDIWKNNRYTANNQFPTTSIIKTNVEHNQPQPGSTFVYPEIVNMLINAISTGAFPKYLLYLSTYKDVSMTENDDESAVGAKDYKYSILNEFPRLRSKRFKRDSIRPEHMNLISQLTDGLFGGSLSRGFNLDIDNIKKYLRPFMTSSPVERRVKRFLGGLGGLGLGAGAGAAGGLGAMGGIGAGGYARGAGIAAGKAGGTAGAKVSGGFGAGIGPGGLSANIYGHGSAEANGYGDVTGMGVGEAGLGAGAGLYGVGRAEGGGYGMGGLGAVAGAGAGAGAYPYYGGYGAMPMYANANAGIGMPYRQYLRKP